MICLVKPTFEQLAFKKALLADKKTMTYNLKWGGTIDFQESRWQDWYQKWVLAQDDRFFYRYVYDSEKNIYVGEAAYHYEPETGRYLADVIIMAQYRFQGYGSQALKLLCREAKQRNVAVLYDDIAKDNSSLYLFLKQGFEKVAETEEVITVQKRLSDEA